MSRNSSKLVPPSTRASNSLVERKTLSTLPPEVILEIARLVSKSQPCSTYGKTSTGSFPFLNHLEPLLQFSSRWRHTLIGCHSLWTHMDLVARSCECGHLLLAHAKTRVQRAGDLPLSLHISEVEEEECDELEASDELIDFIDLVASRLATLHIQPEFDLYPLLRVLLDRSLAKATPGGLTQLMVINPTLVDNDLGRLGYVSTVTSWVRPRLSRPNSPPECQETLRLITTLKLHDLFYDWASPLYHGLSELSLTLCYTYPTITETQLVGILGASPRLRVLRLRLLIHEPVPDNFAQHPVSLDHLEVLNLRMQFSQVARVLKLISPGPKALEMSISMDLKDQVKPLKRQDWSDLREFFARSNVTRLDACNWATQPWVPDLLARIPDLEVLSLNHKSCYHDVSPEYTTIDPTVRRRLGTVKFYSCTVDTQGLPRLLQRFDVQSLTFDRCKFRFDFRSGKAISHGEAKRELAKVCSVTRCKLIILDDDSANV